MITLTLLHPIQSTPVQSWTFEHEPVIRIGRSTDNHVILYSAVVSRHHVELRRVNDRWEILNLGANGTYLDGKQVAQVPVVDGVIIRLARSGPNIQIHLSSNPPLSGEKTAGQRAKPKPEEPPADRPATKAALPSLSAAVPSTRQPTTELDQVPPEGLSGKPLVPQRSRSQRQEFSRLDASLGLNLDCTHQRAQADMMFCPDCGQPLQILSTIGEYQVIKILGEDPVGMTLLVWRNGQSLLLKTLAPSIVSQPEAVDLFEQQGRTLLQLNHPGLPRFVDFFVLEGRPYLIQEQVYGQNLHYRVAARGPLAQEQAIAYMLQVCDVLEYLHQQSPPLLHQNLTPENLIQRLRTPAGEGITVTGFAALTPFRQDTQPSIAGYRAPEQQQGTSTPASDFYALGPILVYLLTGKEPQEFYAQREQGFRFYPEYVPGLTPDFVAIIRRLTNPKPEERYTSATEIIEVLNQLSVTVAEKL